MNKYIASAISTFCMLVIVLAAIITFGIAARPFIFPQIASATHYNGGLTRPQGLGPMVIQPSTVSGNVQIRWNAVSGAQGYNIYVDNMTNRDATDCANPAAGDKCYTTTSTSYTLPNISSTLPYKVTVQAYKTNPANANVPYLSPIAFTFLNVPSYRVISGYVKDTAGKPVAGVKIAVQSGDVRYAYATTDTTGKFTVSNHIKYNEVYAVRVSSLPSGYVSPAKTSTLGWNWNFCTNPNWSGGKIGIDPSLYNHPWGDTPVGSASYECQYAGSQIDCAGPENTAAFTAGRCSFKVGIVPTSTPTKAPTITPTRVPTATNTPTPTTHISCPIVPVDVMLVLDRSSSMWGQSVDGKTKLAWAKDAAKRFVNEFRATGATVRVGVASFAYDGRTHIAPRAIKIDTDYNAVINAINAVPSGHTRSCLECGLYEANIKLRDAGLNNGNTKTKKVVVFLSDGRANAVRGDTSSSNDTAGNKAIAEAVRGRGNGKFGNVYGYNIMYFVNGYGLKVSDADGGIREWVLKGPAKDTTLGTLGIANGTGSPYYKYMDDPRNWDDIFNGFQDTICTMSAFRASAGEANQDVAGAQTGKITIDRATLIRRITEFVDSLMVEYSTAQ